MSRLRAERCGGRAVVVQRCRLYSLVSKGPGQKWKVSLVTQGWPGIRDRPLLWSIPGCRFP